MSKKLLIALIAVLTAGQLFIASAERFINIQIGPTWPRDLLDTDKPTAWNASATSGIIVDRKVAFGAGMDFLWNHYAKESKIIPGVYRTSEEQRTLMFPIMGYFAIIPLPDLVVNPQVTGQVGLNTMYFSHKTETDDTSVQQIDANGWYMGVIWKIGADALVKLGDNSGLIAGVEYLWTVPSKLMAKRDDNLTARRDMRGIGLRFGFRAAY